MVLACQTPDLHVLNSTLDLDLNGDVLDVISVQVLSTDTANVLTVVHVQLGVTGDGTVVVGGGHDLDTLMLTVEVQVVNVEAAVLTDSGNQVGELIQSDNVVLVLAQIHTILGSIIAGIVLDLGLEVVTVAVVLLVGGSVVSDLLGGQATVVEAEAVHVTGPSALGVIVTPHEGIGDVGVLGNTGSQSNTVHVNGAERILTLSHGEGNSQSGVVQQLSAVVHLGTILVLVVVLELQVVVGITTVGHADEQSELVVIGAHQGDPVGCGEVDLTQNHLEGVLLTVDNVNNGIGEVGGVVGYVESVIGPVVVLVGLNSHVVAVTGQILPNGSLVILGTVGVVGSIVPDNQIVSHDIGLLGGRRGNAKGCEASQNQGHGYEHRKCSLECVHCFIPFLK